MWTSRWGWIVQIPEGRLSEKWHLSFLIELEIWTAKSCSSWGAEAAACGPHTVLFCLSLTAHLAFSPVASGNSMPNLIHAEFLLSCPMLFLKLVIYFLYFFTRTHIQTHRSPFEYTRVYNGYCVCAHIIMINKFLTPQLLAFNKAVSSVFIIPTD